MTALQSRSVTAHEINNTNGEEATEVRKQLQRDYDIKPIFSIDNHCFNGRDVLNLDEAKKYISEKTRVLICSDRVDIYKELREVLYKKISADRILDIFFVELPTDKQIENDILKMDKEIRGCLFDENYKHSEV